jgi:hypothetical protein
MSELVTVEPSSEAIEAAANYLVEISGRFGSNLPATFRWYDCLARAYAIDVAPLIAKIEKLPALVAERETLKKAEPSEQAMVYFSLQTGLRGELWKRLLRDAFIGVYEIDVAPLKEECDALKEERDDALAKRDAAIIRVEESKNTIKRIWSQLGNPSYESLNGKSIFDIVDDLIADRDRLAAKVERLTVELGKERDEAREVAHYANGTADLAMKHRDEAESSLTAARETIAKLWEALTAFLSAQQTNDRGEYAGWRISGRGSVNEAAERARAVLAQLDTAPNTPGHADLMISPEAIDVALAANIVPQIMVDYTNWRGERRVRDILPLRIFFGSNQWHKEPQWLMEVVEPDDSETKTLAFAGIHGFVEKDGGTK